MSRCFGLVYQFFTEVFTASHGKFSHYTFPKHGFNIEDTKVCSCSTGKCTQMLGFKINN